MSDINQITLKGQVCKEPKFKVVNGLEILEYVLLVKLKRKNERGEIYEKLNEIPFTVFGKVANYCNEQHIGIGDELFVEGHVNGRQWKGKHYSSNVGTRVHLLQRHTGG